MSSNGAVHEELNAELHHMGYKHHFSIEDRADQIEDDLKAVRIPAYGLSSCVSELGGMPLTLRALLK